MKRQRLRNKPAKRDGMASWAVYDAPKREGGRFLRDQTPKDRLPHLFLTDFHFPENSP